MVQYSSALKSSLSLSLSTISLTATLWTLPADNPYITFFHSKGDNLYPTNLSKILRACCALTKFILISPKFLNASSTALSVNSWNETLPNFLSDFLFSFPLSLPLTLLPFLIFFPFCWSKYFRCHAIASPSLSGSVAKIISLTSLDLFFKRLIVFFAFGGTTYSGSKLFSTSTPKPLLGKSLICPMDASIM